jgi:hypothetical protein
MSCPSSCSTTAHTLSCSVPCHHFTLQISDKTDKESTLRLKPCSNPQCRHCSPGPGATQLSSAWEFSLTGCRSGLQGTFTPNQCGSCCGKPFPPGQLPGGFAHPVAVLHNSSQANIWHLIDYSRPLGLQTSGLEVWGEPCRGFINNNDIRKLPSLQNTYAALAHANCATVSLTCV